MFGEGLCMKCEENVWVRDSRGRGKLGEKHGFVACMKASETAVNED